MRETAMHAWSLSLLFSWYLTHWFSANFTWNKHWAHIDMPWFLLLGFICAFGFYLLRLVSAVADTCSVYMAFLNSMSMKTTVIFAVFMDMVYVCCSGKAGDLLSQSKAPVFFLAHFYSLPTLVVICFLMSFQLLQFGLQISGQHFIVFVASMHISLISI